MMRALLDEKTWDENDFDALLKMAPKNGIFMGTHTLEVDLFKSGLKDKFVEALNDVGTSEPMKERMKGWAKDMTSLDTEAFLKDIDLVGKGRIAQRLATIISASKTRSCPDYVAQSLKYVYEKCKRD